jgi:GH43 family beta-xylosidase
MMPGFLRRWLLLLMFVSVLILGFTGMTTATAAPGRPFADPVKAQKGADPWIEYYNGNYYLVTTSWTSVLTMRRSPTLAGLATAPSVQVRASDQASRCCNYWAPEPHPANGRWYLYFSGGPAGTDYVNNGSVWGTTQNMVIAHMSNPYTVSGPLTTISTPTLSWERQDGTVNEGPEPLYHNGKTFIVYSASACWGPNHKLGLLTYNGGNPLSASAWTKSPQPVFQRNDGGSRTWVTTPVGW